MTFLDRWQAATAALPHLCLGIDPSADLLRQWGLPYTARGAEQFGLACVQAAAGTVPMVKTQIAYFEQFGSSGIAALENVLAAARDAGLQTVVDAKRNDIGSTMDAYARAYLHPDSPLRTDAVTANPYLGLGALAPMLHAALEHGRTVFVLVRTSNGTESDTVQQAMATSGRTVAQALADEIADWNRNVGAAGTVGAVIGATGGAQVHDLATRLQGAPVLAPGVGAQGAGVADALAAFPAGAPVVLPVSRAVLATGPDPAAMRQTLHRLTAERAGA